MKKIITGMLGIVGTLAIVGGIAYAVVFGHVNATASATTTNDLQVSSDGGGTYSTAIDLSSNPFSHLTTVGNGKVLVFENLTSKDTTALSVQQVGTLTGDTGIANDIQVAFVNGSTTTIPTTGWKGLVDWETAGQQIAGVVIPAGLTHNVTMFVRLDPTTTSAGNSSYNVGGINFDFGPLY